jgi:23S rRNA (pseudouridine1915-N3)-methyltransferase
MAARPQVTILAVGKLRETYFRDACAEYVKRLGRLTSAIALVEVADEATPDDASAAQEAQIRAREGERLLARVGPRDTLVVCDGGRGTMLSSEALAAWIETACAEEGSSHLVFAIGGSLGHDPQVIARAHRIVSFGPLTFPHQLLRVMLLEQLYRAFKINAGQAYHK